jgi:succinyl-CoA synthetase beta subunit
MMLCDAKLNFDDNAAYRQSETASQRDIRQEDPHEVEAEKFDLNYIGLDGNIGCLVNGAGLAMATMDVIKLFGGEPANFLDVGGGADVDQIVEAFRILQTNQNVSAILVNIFGGIMRCDIIAEAIVTAAKSVGLTKPLVVRLRGTNKQQAIDILESSDVNVDFTEEMEDAAQKVAKLA